MEFLAGTPVECRGSKTAFRSEIQRSRSSVRRLRPVGRPTAQLRRGG